MPKYPAALLCAAITGALALSVHPAWGGATAIAQVDSNKQQLQKTQAQGDPGQQHEVLTLPHADPEPVPGDPQPAADAPLIQIALLLDTSNSMDGLIDQAKAQLWMIVNRFAQAKRDGIQPNFQIALFEYGNTKLPAEEGYIRQVVAFTNDLDAVSQALFGLTTQGGDEYCGMVMDEALTRLPWSEAGNDFKAIYIAGNEPFTQGEVNYIDVCERAVEMGVLVNTIHCGDEEAGISGKWQHGSQLAGGSFLTINQDRSIVHEPAPQDEQLAALNTQLNATYLPYGDAGKQLQDRQAAVDESNAGLSNEALAQRTVSKANALYRNANWDLVDACNEEEFDLGAVPDEQLPEDMRGLSLEEKKKYIEQKREERKAIQDQINKLAAERAEHIAEERAKKAEEEGESLGEAVDGIIGAQLEAEGFEVEKE